MDALSELIFVDPGAKINGQYYRDVLLQKKLLPAIRRVSGNMFTFQQDSAPVHRAWDTIELLRRSTPDFFAPDMWPPTCNSPDILVDYAIWSIMQQSVYQTRVRDIDEPRQRLTSASEVTTVWRYRNSIIIIIIITVWCGLAQRAVDDAIDQWQRRLRACVDAEGGHFEHNLGL